MPASPPPFRSSGATIVVPHDDLDAVSDRGSQPAQVVVEDELDITTETPTRRMPWWGFVAVGFVGALWALGTLLLLTGAVGYLVYVAAG